jgi:hypothetical protein
VEADPPFVRGRLTRDDVTTERRDVIPFHRGSGGGMPDKRRSFATREAPIGGGRVLQPDAREGRFGPNGVTERLVVPKGRRSLPVKPGNSGGGKEPWLKVSAGSDKGQGDWR